MEVIRTKCNAAGALQLGVRGENLARRIEIDYCAWAEEYGEGVLSLSARRANEVTLYPVALEPGEEEHVAVWQLTDVDTNNAGTGACELQYRVGDTLVKSVTRSTNVTPSLDGDVTSASASQPLIDQVGDLVAEAKAAAERVLDLTADAVTLEPGSDATVTKTETADGINLTFGIPRGADGEDGGGGCDCYTVEEGTQTIVAEQSVTTSSGDPSPLTNASYDASLSGKTVSVTFDGAPYECTAVLDRFGELLVGGFDGDDISFEEYPFCVVLVPGGWSYSSVLFTQTAGEHTIKAEAATKTVTPSDNFKLAVRASPGLRLKRQTSGSRPMELIYDSEAVTTDAAGNITDITDRTQFAMIPTDALFWQSSSASQITLGYYNADGQLRTLNIPLGGSGSGSGDMTKNVYDNDSTVQNAGGIKNYVQTYVSEHAGEGGDGTFAPNDPGHGGRTDTGTFLYGPLWERAEDVTVWGDPVWRAEIFGRGSYRIYGILKDDERTVLDFSEGTGYMLQVSAALNDLQRLVNAGVTGLLARIEKPDAAERAFNALAYPPDSEYAPRLVLYAFGATPPEGVDIRVTATLLDRGGLG